MKNSQLTREQITNDSDKPLTVHGVPGRLTHRTRRDGMEAGLWCRQRWISERRPVKGWGTGAVIVAEMRFDDDCGNGHNSFAITAEIFRPGARDCEACGCLHDEVAEYFPELAPLIKWHLTSSDGPLHYIANTVYHAGDRDCWGLRKGETRPSRDPKGAIFWKLEAVNAEGVLISSTPTGDEYRKKETVPLFILEDDIKAEQPPAVVPVLRWVQQMKTGEGKARELDFARSSAVWPEATDAELTVEPEELRKKLVARHPQLMADFRKAIEGAGFIWEAPAEAIKKED
jgi:hypothetical protein